MLNDTNPMIQVLSKRKGIRKTSKEFWLYTIGVLLNLVPASVVFVLQSSINIEENKGTLSLGVSYVVSLIALIFVTPVAIRRFGTKWVLVIGELGYLVYACANFYPKKYIMIIAGVIKGIGECMVWTCLPLYCWSFGYLHGQFGSNSFEYYVQKYTAIFFAMFQISRISGSLISYAVLFGFKNKTEVIQLPGLDENLTEHFNVDIYQYCGSNDCQNANVTQENIDRYIPANTTSLYILISIFIVMTLCGMVLQMCCLAGAITKPSTKLKSIDIDEKTLDMDQNGVNKQVNTFNYKSTVMATLKQMVDLKQLWITPIITFRGMMTSFFFSESVRAFVSCVLGVEQIGAVLILNQITNGITSAISGRLIKRFGRNRIMFFNSFLTMATFLFQLLWKITEKTKYLVYLLYFLCGIINGFWRNCNLDIYNWYFPHNKEIAIACWNFWATTGFAIGFLSSGLCLEIKIYILIGLLLFSMACYGIVEYIYERSKSTSAAK